MASLELVNAAARNVSEADVRALALAKVNATKTFNALLYANEKSMTDEQLVDREIDLAAARKAMYAAQAAFDKAV